MLAIVLLGVASLGVLQSAHLRSREVLQSAISSLDNVSESRRRLLRAYLIHDRQLAGDRTFGHSSPLAELKAAEHAWENWAAGRSGLIDFPASAPDSAALAQGQDYAAALARLQELLLQDRPNTVALRRQFSEAESAVAGLEEAIRAAVRDSVRAEERAHRIRLATWGSLLFLSVLGAAYARRAFRESENRRAASESRLSRLRAAAPVAIAECDTAGRVIASNRAWSAFTGLPEEAWAGSYWWESLHELDQDQVQRQWRAAPDADMTTMEARLARAEKAEGSTDWVLIRISEEGAAETAKDHRVVTLTDITQQRHVEEQLHHAQRMETVGRLAGGVAHDFNNLLTTIAGFAALASDAVNDDQGLQEDLLEIRRAADRGKALTRQLLTFSRQDRTNPQIIDVRDAVRNLQRMLARLVPEDVRIRMELGDSPATVLADANQIEQVVTNLVINASDAMEGRGEVRIAVDTVRVEEAFAGAKGDIQAGHYVLLTISDTGPGIPPAIRPRIFDPFFTTKERGKGTGLGLSTVWGIVRQGGGHIHVYSEVGQGAVFKIYLPAEQWIPESELVENESVARSGGGTALVVEDEDAVRRLTRRILELRGWRVLEAINGTEALALLETHAPDIDLLITDVMMRGMGGAELVEWMHAEGMALPVLFVSGYSESEVNLTGSHFLEKPFTPEALLTSIAAVLQDQKDETTRERTEEP